jgi:hypothetical protein
VFDASIVLFVWFLVELGEPLKNLVVVAPIIATDAPSSGEAPYRSVDRLTRGRTDRQTKRKGRHPPAALNPLSRVLNLESRPVTHEGTVTPHAS